MLLDEHNQTEDGCDKHSEAVIEQVVLNVGYGYEDCCEER